MLDDRGDGLLVGVGGIALDLGEVVDLGCGSHIGGFLLVAAGAPAGLNSEDARSGSLSGQNADEA
jgi:hypothetical protein